MVLGQHQVSYLLLVKINPFYMHWIRAGIDCPKGWFTVPPFTSCFYLGKDDVNYDMANESCKSRSSILAKVHSVEELTSLAKWISLERYDTISNYKSYTLNLLSAEWLVILLLCNRNEPRQSAQYCMLCKTLRRAFC